MWVSRPVGCGYHLCVVSSSIKMAEQKAGK
nr:MAG TPA: LPS-assembly lipoprotein [Caudoviricetes sp.]